MLEAYVETCWGLVELVIGAVCGAERDDQFESDETSTSKVYRELQSNRLNWSKCTNTHQFTITRYFDCTHQAL